GGGAFRPRRAGRHGRFARGGPGADSRAGRRPDHRRPGARLAERPATRPLRADRKGAGRPSVPAVADHRQLARDPRRALERPVAVGTLLGRADWTRALLTGIDAGKVQASELTLEQKQNLMGHPNRAVARRAKEILSRGGGLPNPDRQKVVDELLSLTRRTGD